jgi:two-component system, response regulator / RNA-binding antiterminator
MGVPRAVPVFRQGLEATDGATVIYCGAELDVGALILCGRKARWGAPGQPAWHSCCSELGMTEAALRILLVDQNMTRASILEEGLREAGYTNVTVVRDMQNLLRRIVDEDPDVICIDLENPNRDVLEQMFQVSRVVRRPVAMFVDRSDSDMIKAAVESGVGAYVVDGLRKERVKAVVDMAVSRFKAFNDLREELEQAKQALGERKVIERAKGILMNERGLTEDAAYALLRKAAMSDNRRVVEIAQAVITAAGLLR